VGSEKAQTEAHSQTQRKPKVNFMVSAHPQPLTPSVAGRSYALEDLYIHQDRDLVAETIPAVLAWLNYTTVALPVRFQISVPSTGPGPVVLALTWDLTALEHQDPGVKQRAYRLLTGRSPQREHVAELAGYGLAMVAISILLPARRVVEYRRGLAPDLLLDNTPGALRGIEVAARKSGGFSALRTIRMGTPARFTKPSRGRKRRRKRRAIKGKASQLRAMQDVTEAHLSLWCCTPQVSEFVQVKP
jgi:hypothetical protein